MAGLTIRPAVAGDHVELADLFGSTTMGTRIRIGIERDPDYFAGSRIKADKPEVWAVFESGGRAVGLFSVGSRPVCLGGERRMRYLCDLRIHPDWRGSSMLMRGFSALRREVFQPGEWAQTLVLEDNRAALDLLTSGRANLPDYVPAGRYVSFLLPPQRIIGVTEIFVRQATRSDLGAMQALLDASCSRRSFAGMVDLAELGKPAWRDLEIDGFLVAERRGRLCGMMGLWDQSGFQRLRIKGYSSALTSIRPLWNVWARGRGVGLPKVGEILPMRKATAVACEDDDPVILRALLSAALAGGDKRLLLLGCSAMDPLAAALRGLKARREYGRHFLVGWDGVPPDWEEPFGFDVARI